MFVNFTFAQNEVKEDEFSITICENEKLNFIELENSCFTQIDISLLAKKKYTDKNRIWLEIIVNDKQKKFIVFDKKIDFIAAYQNRDIFLSGRSVVLSKKQLDISTEINAIQILEYSKPIYIELVSSRKIPIEPKIILLTQKEFDQNYLKPRLKIVLIQIFFQGMLWIILLYNLFLFASTKEKVYIAYVAYIFGFSMFSLQNTGLLLDYILPEYPATEYVFRVTGLGIVFIGYSYFILTFLPAYTLNKFWTKFFKGLAFAQIPLTLVYIFVLYHFKNSPLYLTISTPVSGIIMLLVLSFFVYLSRKYWSDIIVKFFLIGSFLVVGGGFVSNFLRVFGGDIISDVYVIVQAGGVLEILIFSLGLGYRMKQLEQKNAEILRTQNVVLEEKVTERTREITVQNEELHQQQEEIISQRDYIEKQNIQLKHTNTQFTDSVRYAKTIQEAILPFGKRLTTNFEEYFIFFRPRDIVSGDFYWIYEVNNPITNEDMVLIAVLDCTGHGVPGAFISLIGFAILNEIVSKENITSPSKILERLDERLQEALKQKQTNNMDGMDVALCSIKKIELQNTETEKQFEVIFAGAKRPLYYIKNNELNELKGNKMSVGGITKKKENTDIEFDEEKIILSKGDKIYLTSDGFADQNGSNNKKIGSLKLKESLEEFHTKPFTEQKTKLEQILDTHKGKQKQRDDITILGVKL